MSVESVKKEVEKKGYEIEFIEFEESTATVDLAAKALGTRPENIGKSLGIRLKEEDIIILVSGTRRLDNKKFKDVFKEKPRFIKAEDVFEATGHEVGGVTPFGLSKDLKVYLDESLKDLDLVYPAGGSPKTCLKLSIDHLEEIFNSSWVNVTK